MVHLLARDGVTAARADARSAGTPSHLRRVDLHHPSSSWNDHRLPTPLPARAGAFLNVCSLDQSCTSSLCKHPVITQTASKTSRFFQASAFWTHSGGITKRSVGALREESSSSCAWVSALLLCSWFWGLWTHVCTC